MAVLPNRFGVSVKLSHNDHFSSPSITRPTYLSPPSRRNLVIRATPETETERNGEGRSLSKEKASTSKHSNFNQLLGIRGAAQDKDKWKIHLQLTKPVTWPPLVWGVVCGAAASAPPPVSSARRTRASQASTSAPPRQTKPHRFKPGTVALREIRKYQKTSDLLIPFAPFVLLGREIISTFSYTVTRWTPEALMAIQEWSNLLWRWWLVRRRRMERGERGRQVNRKLKM